MARLVRERGVRSSLGAPIVVEGQLWGALVAATDREEPLPAGTEFRLARFTDLIATAISNTATRSELIASRARIVSAGDEARQRIERNLHDGTQQRLIALGLDVQRVRATIPDDQHDAHLELERVEEALGSVLEDLRELSRGLHPPLLSRRGLRSSLRALARDSPIPVELEIDLPERPPAPLEIAVYYVVSEALTNAIKHSQASAISITIETDHAGGPFGVGLDGRSRGVKLHATIADDGVGGADASVGSGLTGLADRVEALGGRFALDTPPRRRDTHLDRVAARNPLADPPDVERRPVRREDAVVGVLAVERLELCERDRNRIVGRPRGETQDALDPRLAQVGDRVVGEVHVANAPTRQRVARTAQRNQPPVLASSTSSHCAGSSHGIVRRASCPVVPWSPSSAPAKTIGTPGVVICKPTPTICRGREPATSPKRGVSCVSSSSHECSDASHGTPARAERITSAA